MYAGSGGSAVPGRCDAARKEGRNSRSIGSHRPLLEVQLVRGGTMWDIFELWQPTSEPTNAPKRGKDPGNYLGVRPLLAGPSFPPGEALVGCAVTQNGTNHVIVSALPARIAKLDDNRIIPVRGRHDATELCWKDSARASPFWPRPAAGRSVSRSRQAKCCRRAARNVLGCSRGTVGAEAPTATRMRHVGPGAVRPRTLNGGAESNVRGAATDVSCQRPVNTKLALVPGLSTRDMKG